MIQEVRKYIKKGDPDKAAELLFNSNSEKILVARNIIRIINKTWDLAVNYHVNTKGQRLEFDNFGHMKEIYHDKRRMIVIKSCVQSGKTEWLVIESIAMAHYGLAVFYVMEKSDHITTFVQNRIDKPIEIIPIYKAMYHESYGSASSVKLKHFGRGVIKYVSSNVISDFTEFPADVVIVDEYDHCNLSNIIYGVDRMEFSKYKIKRYIGNPTIKGYGLDLLYDRSDQRKWSVDCPNCKLTQPITFFDNVVDLIGDSNYKLKDKEWTEKSKRDINLYCKKCGSEINRKDSKARWVKYNSEGKYSGYHISQMIIRWKSVESIWTRFQEAMGSEIELQHFYNSVLGLAYSGTGSQISIDILNNCIRDTWMLPDKYNGLDKITMGVDVGTHFDVRVSQIIKELPFDCKMEYKPDDPEYEEEYESKLIRKRLMLYVGKVKTKSEIVDLVRIYKVNVIVMDAMPEKRAVEDIRNMVENDPEISCDCWFAYRNTNKAGATGKEFKIDYLSREINVDRTWILDLSLRHLKERINILPVHAPDLLGGKYYTEMKEPVRKLEDSGNKQYYVWTKGNDHQRDADTYDIMANDFRLRVGGVRTI